MDAQMRTWAEISLRNIEHNYKTLRVRLEPVGARFLGIVKANAYGHGAVPVARLLESLSCEDLGVACLAEAVELRGAGIKSPILVLGYTDPKYAAELKRYDLTQTVTDPAQARALSCKVHLKIDTGMSRLGFPCETTEELLETLRLPKLDFEGVYTHFAVSEDENDGFTLRQLEKFQSLLRELSSRGFHFKIRHCANSGAVLNYTQSHLDMARPGIALYGVTPAPGMTAGADLKPAMTLKTRVAQLRILQAGDTVSYGRRFTAEGETRVAVLPVGYADGLPRVLSNKLEVLINGRRAAQLGTVCMDMCMIDLTGRDDVRVGDEAELFGAGIPVWEPAQRAGTIPYELLCAVSSRVPRVYVD
jgi:alanine racemase